MQKIVLGTVVGPHGRPNDRGQKFKVSLYSFASPYLAQIREFFVKNPNGQDWKKFSVVDDVQSSGAKWGQAREILVFVSASDALERGAEIAIDRALVPPPAEGEFFIADLLGLEVFDENSKLVGKVVGCEDPVSRAMHRDLTENNNLVIESPRKKQFSVPFAWIPRESFEVALKGGALVIEGVDQWVDIDSHARDEDDDEP